MGSVKYKLQRPRMDFIDANFDRWDVEYLACPDGPPFISLDFSRKLKSLGVTSKGFRVMTLRIGGCRSYEALYASV
jgi:hypothetical protein